MRPRIYVAWLGKEAYPTAIRAAKTLRNNSYIVELALTGQKLRKALEHANRVRANYALILGEDEVQSGQWTLKTLSTGEQTKLSEADLLQFLLKQEQPK